MFELEISRSISCAHYLRGYHGECCHLHGHNYRVCVVIRAAQLDEIGISADFRKLKAAADELLERYDHRCLNDLPEFAERNPTSENLAKHLYGAFSERMNDGNVRIHAVRVWESESSCATYFEEA